MFREKYCYVQRSKFELSLKLALGTFHFILHNDTNTTSIKGVSNCYRKFYERQTGKKPFFPSISKTLIKMYLFCFTNKGLINHSRLSSSIGNLYLRDIEH